MITLTLQVRNAAGEVLAERSGEGQAELCYLEEYQEGDRIVLLSSQHPVHVHWQVDDVLRSSLCYLTKDMEYPVPFGERKTVYSNRAFTGVRHFIYARVAEDFEIKTNAENLGDALLEAKLVEGEMGDYGLYIKSVNGIRADYELDGAYWSLSKGGEMLMTGASDTPIADGDTFELTYTK